MKTTWAVMDGLVLGTLFTLVVLVLMRRMPRGMLHMLPKSFESHAPAPSRRETLAFYHRYIPALAVITTAMVISGALAYDGTSVRFGSLFLHGYVIAMFLNLGDAVFLDLLEIGSRPEFYGRAWGVDPDRLRPREFFRLLTFKEHCLVWPLLYCPLVGLLYAALVGWASR